MSAIPGLVIRTALPRDRESLLDLMQELNRHEAKISGDRLTDRAAAEASYATLVDRVSRLQGHLVVTEVKGQVVGAFGLVVETDAAHVDARVRRYGAVTNLVVHPAWRRQGIGTRLLQEAERLSREIGLRRLVIAMLAGNAGAERAYKSLGFGDYAKVLVKPLD
jgi:ribosomal protein S18 acetylase RimI-like enzyme